MRGRALREAAGVLQAAGHGGASPEGAAEEGGERRTAPRPACARIVDESPPLVACASSCTCHESTLLCGKPAMKIISYDTVIPYIISNLKESRVSYQINQILPCREILRAAVHTACPSYSSHSGRTCTAPSCDRRPPHCESRSSGHRPYSSPRGRTCIAAAPSSAPASCLRLLHPGRCLFLRESDRMSDVLAEIRELALAPPSSGWENDVACKKHYNKHIFSTLPPSSECYSNAKLHSKLPSSTVKRANLLSL